MKRRSSVWVFAIAGALAAAACSSGCPSGGLVSVGEAIRDDDDDGWFTNETNQRVRLRLARASLPQPGRYAVIVDGVRFPFNNSLDGSFEATQSNQDREVESVVATEAIGTWLLQAPEQRLTFRSEITIRSWVGSTLDEVTETVEWQNREGEFNHIFNRAAGNDVILRFRVEIDKFADPTPNNGDGDSDEDGITDFEEGAGASSGFGVGHPGERDLVLIVGYTHPDWKLTQLSRELLLTRFRQRGIRMLIVDAPDARIGLAAPGQIFLDGETPPRDHAMSLDDADEVRSQHARGIVANFAHWLVLAEQLTPPAYGWAQLPGRNLIARSHLPLLGPDFHQYQAKDVMHELGHNLGLCHPTESDDDDDCPSGAIPESEQDPGASVMGAPIEEDNIIGQIQNALARPLDYSTGQWANVQLSRVRP